MVYGAGTCTRSFVSGGVAKRDEIRSRLSIRCLGGEDATGQLLSRRRWSCLCGGVVVAVRLEGKGICQARTPTEQPTGLEQTPPATVRKKPSNRDQPPEDVRSEVLQIQKLTEEAESAAKNGDYPQALKVYSEIVRLYPDLAVTEYARLHRALLLYETGNVRRSILELDDLEVSLRGFPEVHAALAVVLYVERPQQLSRAEEQWEIAMTFDSRFTDPKWVEQTKHWTPRMTNALERFLSLR